MSQTKSHPMVKQLFENACPILKVSNLESSVRYYVDVLGFKNAAWGPVDFTQVTRDNAGIYLTTSPIGGEKSWVWVGIEDVGALYDEYKSKGALIKGTPQNYPWAYEMLVQDHDGHVLRFGSDSRKDIPIVE